MAPIENEYIIHGPDFLEEIPNESFSRTIYRCLKEHYNLPIALVDNTTRKSVSFKTVVEQSLRLAYSLQSYGIKQNDVIAISSENSVNYVYPLIASIWVGATLTLFNPSYTPREIAHVANISQPSLIFCSKMSLHHILETRKQLKFIKKVITIDGYDKEEDVETMEHFVARNSRDYKRFEPVDPDLQSVAVIMYSSGTTGLPKGVMLTHNNLNVTFLHFRDPHIFVHRAPGTATVLGFLPIFHVYGLSAFTFSLLLGKSILVLPKFEERSFLTALQDFKIPIVFLVPPVAHLLVNSNIADNYDLSCVKEIVCGAASLSTHTEHLLLKRFHNVKNIQNGYGLTEVTFAALLCPLSSAKDRTAGKLLAGTAAKVVDINTGRSVGPGISGELFFRGPHVMKGYAGDAGSTNSTIDSNGWLKSGDFGYYDEEGYFYIVDRLKDLIKYKGFQVAPAELEAVLLEHPKILDAGVIGVPDELAGEMPLAFVIRKSNQNLTEDDVKKFVAKEVAPHKQLRGGVRFVQEIPRNPTGKILRRQLRQLVTQKCKL